jgi:hypothetical protein
MTQSCLVNGPVQVKRIYIGTKSVEEIGKFCFKVCLYPFFHELVLNNVKRLKYIDAHATIITGSR